VGGGEGCRQGRAGKGNNLMEKRAPHTPTPPTPPPPSHTHTPSPLWNNSFVTPSPLPPPTHTPSPRLSPHTWRSPTDTQSAGTMRMRPKGLPFLLTATRGGVCTACKGSTPPMARMRRPRGVTVAPAAVVGQGRGDVWEGRGGRALPSPPASASVPGPGWAAGDGPQEDAAPGVAPIPALALALAPVPPPTVHTPGPAPAPAPAPAPGVAMAGSSTPKSVVTTAVPAALVAVLAPAAPAPRGLSTTPSPSTSPVPALPDLRSRVALWVGRVRRGVGSEMRRARLLATGLGLPWVCGEAPGGRATGGILDPAPVPVPAPAPARSAAARAAAAAEADMAPGAAGRTSDAGGDTTMVTGAYAAEAPEGFTGPDTGRGREPPERRVPPRRSPELEGVNRRGVRPSAPCPPPAPPPPSLLRVGDGVPGPAPGPVPVPPPMRGADPGDRVVDTASNPCGDRSP
jgi:hypothetical protein